MLAPGLGVDLAAATATFPGSPDHRCWPVRAAANIDIRYRSRKIPPALALFCVIAGKDLEGWAHAKRECGNRFCINPYHRSYQPTPGRFHEIPPRLMHAFYFEALPQAPIEELLGMFRQHGDVRAIVADMYPAPDIEEAWRSFCTTNSSA